MSSRNITVQVDTETYKEIKKIAFERETTIKDIINTYLADGVQKEKGQTKL